MHSNIIFLFLILLSFFSAEAKVKANVKSKANGSLRLEQYFANPVKDFSWMNDEEKANYISFIVNLNMLLETELSRGTVLMINDNLKKESHFKWQKEFLKELFSVEESRAVGPLLLPFVPAAGTALSTVVRSYAPSVITYVVRQAPKAVIDITPQAASWWQKLTSAKGLMVASTGATAAYVAVDSVTGNSEGTPPPPVANGKSGTDGGIEVAGPVPAAASAAKAVGGTVSGSATVATEAPAPPSVTGTEPAMAQQSGNTEIVTVGSGSNGTQATKTSLNTVVSSRAEGSFCIFGGYGSRYKVVESRAFCPAPTEMVNNPFCAGKKNSPSFLCQSFGLSKSRTESIISDTLCIPLRSEKGLADLTVRCAKAFADFADLAKAIDPAQLTEIQNQVRQGIAALEAERGIGDVGLLGYCKEENKLNRGIQRGECKALTELMDKYKKDFPKIVASAQTATAKPTAPAAPANPGSAPARR